MLAESGLPSLDERIYEAKLKLISKLIFPNNSIIDMDVKKQIVAKRSHRIPSAIEESLHLASSLHLHLTAKPSKCLYPPWLFNSDLCDTSLSKFCKQTHSKEIFIRLYLEKENSLISEGWNFFFTDGSKIPNSTSSYAIVDNVGSTLKLKILPDYTSIFTAEASAILNAILIAIDIKQKTVICTDSLSVSKAIRNTTSRKWNIVNHIRDLLIRNSKILKILWIPGHTNIIGNVKADEAAKFAVTAPVIMEFPIEKFDIKSYIHNHIRIRKLSEWAVYSHSHYKDLNMTLKQPVYPTNVSKQHIKIFSRLRLGHTYSTHGHLIKRDLTSVCPNCGANLTIDHILIHCTHFADLRNSIFESSNPRDLLKIPSYTNIVKIFNFIVHTGFII